MTFDLYIWHGGSPWL